jgi:hypothetical protein
MDLDGCDGAAIRRLVQSSYTMFKGLWKETAQKKRPLVLAVKIS